jgi:DNA repair protein RecO
MHEVVISEGLVLSKRPVREADTLVQLFTPSGLLRAKATSARAEKSKLRYGLEPLTLARYSLVHGRHEWRLTGVTGVSRRFIGGAPAQRAACARISKLLTRLIHGQEASPQLYQTVIEGFDALTSSSSLESIEVVLVLRILSHLGYLPHSEALAPFIDGGFDVELSAKALEARALLVRTINESLQATGL